ncbi:MAG: cob(I)yrinic acid a,c-diamide adenosyltransferase [Nitrospirota bacterium]
MRLQRGLVHIYTGKGKGKTTAAFGLAMRAVGEGLKVLIIQFLKGRVPLTGEAAIAKVMFQSIEILRFNDQVHPLFAGRNSDENKLKESIASAFAITRKKIESGEYDLVVLDEINNVIKGGWLSVAEVAELIKNKPVHTELVLTGRNAPKELIDISDYVTEMKMIKHPSKTGIKARRGIEY